MSEYVPDDVFDPDTFDERALTRALTDSGAARLDATLRAKLKGIVSDESKRRALRDKYVGHGVRVHEEPAAIRRPAPEHLPSMSESEIRRVLNDR